MDWGLTYSQVVAWLKILLPLAALGLLSTLFMLSRTVDTVSSIPFAKIDIEQRAKEQRLTKPYFSGKTRDGDLLAFTASSARPDSDDVTRTLATNLDARIDFSDGSTISFTAKTGVITSDIQQVELQGDVQIISSNGYTVQTETLITSLRETHAESVGPITGNGPAGRFSAGQAILGVEPNSGGSYLLFTKGVKLVYTPQK